MLEPLETHPWLLVLLGAAGVFVVPLVVFRIVRYDPIRRGIQAADTPPRRIFFAVAVSLSVFVILGFGLGLVMPNLQVFEASGTIRLIGLPVGYLLYGLALVYPYKTRLNLPRFPAWWTFLLFAITLSAVFGVFFQRQEVNLSAVAQGLAFVCGFLLFAAVGLCARAWSQDDERRMLVMLGIFAAIAGLGAVSLGPYVAVAAPGAAMMIYASRRVEERRAPLLLLGLAILSAMLFRLFSTNAPSIAEITQIGISVVLLMIALLPRTFRRVALVVGLIGGAALAAQSGIFMLLLGDARGIRDVTLTHRAYETATVFETIGNDPLSFLFGLGPAATVNLTWSPDATTLRSSGRDLSAVDDVHFLTSWLFLKMGVIGLLWLAIFMIALVREAAHVLTAPKPPLFETALLFFVLAGVVTALPAATYVFSNPLPALLLGVLYARRRWGATSGFELGGSGARAVGQRAPRQRRP